MKNITNLCTMRDKLVITGANGQLGQCLKEIASQYPNFDFIFTDVTELDVTSRNAVSNMLKQFMPKWVINCAAYTAVDKAESEIELATLLNATAVGILAEESAKINAGIVHISTDYVFSGDDSKALSEENHKAPSSIYGQTKLQGEIEAQKNQRNIIIRTSWLYSIYGNNFVKTMRRLGKERSELGVVCDQWGTPTSAYDLADVIMTVIQKPVYGIFHYSNEGNTNWADFAQQIMIESGLSCQINKITTEQYPTPAKRPSFSLLSKDKIKKTFGLLIPRWEDSLKRVIELIESK